MRIVFLSNIFSHHQKPISDCLYRLTDGHYWFIETQEMPEERLSLGYKSTIEPYKIHYSEDKECEIIKLVNNADIVLYGSAPYELVKERVRQGKLTYYYTERVFKEKAPLAVLLYLFREFFRKWGRHKNTYLLAASAYASSDFNKLFCFRGKAFKWGYFTEVKEFDSLDDLYNKKTYIQNKRVSIVWVARLISWKHPEFAISIARMLKQAGYQFDLVMIGNGPLSSELQKLVEAQDLTDCVQLLGSMPPEEVRSYMEKGDIYLFTSDRNEGWGAVLNESMNSCCAVVASHAPGSVPFLLKDGVNGFVYRDGDLDSAFHKVAWLIEHPVERRQMGYEAYKTMATVWNPYNAANSLLHLSSSILNGEKVTFYEGPCSVAPILKDSWFNTNFNTEK